MLICWNQSLIWLLPLRGITVSTFPDLLSFWSNWLTQTFKIVNRSLYISRTSPRVQVEEQIPEHPDRLLTHNFEAVAGDTMFVVSPPKCRSNLRHPQERYKVRSWGPCTHSRLHTFLELRALQSYQAVHFLNIQEPEIIPDDIFPQRQDPGIISGSILSADGSFWHHTTQYTFRGKNPGFVAGIQLMMLEWLQIQIRAHISM
jgi:hypothetical protein